MNRSACVWMSLLVGAAPVCAQRRPELPEVGQVLAKCTAALGGQAAAAKISTVHMAGSLEVVNTGAKGTTEICVKAPNRRVVVSSLPGVGLMRSGYNGASGWIQPLGYAPMDAQGAALDDLRRNAGVAPVFQMNQLFSRLGVEGLGFTNGREAYVITAIPAAGRAERWYFDTSSGLPVRVDGWTDEGLPSELDLEDYRDAEGLKFPFTMRLYTPVYHAVTRIESIEVNAPVDDSVFEKPR